MPEATLNSIGVAGWFGKLPGLGDFATRRLPDAFVRRWDRWLERGLATARHELGERWLDAYLVAPILRFWLDPGVLGSRAWAGLMMPSVDRVGRHFPLTFAQPASSLAATLASPQWFSALDAAARQVLDVDFTVDDLERQLDRIRLPEAVAPDAAAQQLAVRLLGRCTGAPPCSLWWCGDAGDESRVLCFPALPPATAFTAMMAGPP